jgi:extradiol dioxygenase family protein
MADVLAPFHLAIPVVDLEAARRFYYEVIGCGTGRTASRWVVLDFFGHQLTLHLVAGDDPAAATNAVDGDEVPSRHFGVVLPRPEWETLAARLEAAGTEFLISPRIRFAGKVGEQATMFLRDPSGNALEFKSFADPAQLFAT